MNGKEEMMVEDLKERLEKALALLRRVQWDKMSNGEESYCSVCGGAPVGESSHWEKIGDGWFPSTGHHDDCELAAMLRGEK